ncbi:MAG: ThuA domain-containing protein [Acidobacteriota bacterium]
MRVFAVLILGICLVAVAGFAAELNKTRHPSPATRHSSSSWVTYEGGEGPGKGKHIVFISGDEEYRSEEALPMLARILAVHHGFRCTVLFAIDPQTGEIKPDVSNIPGLSQLETADLMILFTRWRELPDEQMKYIIDYTNSGKPIIGLRTATHPFKYRENLQSPYAKYSDGGDDEVFEGGYGRQVFGEMWVRHHGVHGKESTRGLINGLMKDHAILRGVSDIWGPGDVYGLRDIHGGGDVLVHGLSLQGMEPDSPPNFAKSLMPVAWIKTYTGETGNTSRVFFTTMGAAVDLESEGLRRLVVNACYWGIGLEDQIPQESNVTYVGEYNPTFFGFGGHQKGLKPEDFELRR